MKRKILITGFQGLIAKILKPVLMERYDIRGVDKRRSFGKNEYRVNISNFNSLSAVFGKIGKVDCIIHLAGEANPKAGWESILQNNIIGIRNIYECSRIYNIKKIIFASSNHVTGGYEKIIRPHNNFVKLGKVISVNDSVSPDGYYGTSKVFGEVIAKQYYELYGIHSICLRFGSVLENDNPGNNKRLQKLWLSHRDLVQIIEKSLKSKTSYGIYYGVSDNKGRFYDITNTRKDLRYKPLDGFGK